MNPVLVHVPFFSRSSAVIGDVSVDDSPTTVHHATTGGHVHLDRRRGGGDQIGSVDSIGSVASRGSIGSIGSIGSVGSVLSIGSAGSILSIGSAGSILSIGSAGSILSIGSLGSIGSIGACGRSVDRVVRPLATTLGLLALGSALRGT